jgi:hypothetical protein
MWSKLGLQILLLRYKKYGCMKRMQLMDVVKNHKRWLEITTMATLEQGNHKHLLTNRTAITQVAKFPSCNLTIKLLHFGPYMHSVGLDAKHTTS